MLHAALDTLLLSVAPVLPFLAEEVHAHRTARPAAAEAAGGAAAGAAAAAAAAVPVWSPFAQRWTAPPDSWTDPPLARRWSLALGAKAEIVRLHHQVRRP